MEMDRACDLGTIHDQVPPRGKTITIPSSSGSSSGDKDITIYVSVPKSNKVLGTVIVIHDIYGFNIPNTKIRGDWLADNNYLAIVPQLMDGWSASRGEPGGPEFQVWRTTLANDAGISDLKTIIEWINNTAIKEYNVQNSKIGIIGFCFGGTKVAQICVEDLPKVTVGVSIHGGNVSADTVKNLKVPVAFLVAEIDRHVTKEVVEETRKEIEGASKDKGCMIKVYEGVNHGFANRGSYDPESNERKKADEALADCLNFLNKHLL